MKYNYEIEFGFFLTALFGLIYMFYFTNFTIVQAILVCVLLAYGIKLIADAWTYQNKNYEGANL